MSQNQNDYANRIAPSGGRDIDPKTGQPAAIGATELTRTAMVGGITDITRQFYRHKENALRAAELAKKRAPTVQYDTRWISDYMGPVQDE